MTTPERPAPRAAVRALFFRRIALAALALAVTVALGAVLYIAVQIRGTQIEGSPTGKRIESCTSPTGECYKRGQAQQAEAIGQIGAGNILAVVCALQVKNGTPLNAALEQVTQCVADRLAAK